MVLVILTLDRSSAIIMAASLARRDRRRRHQRRRLLLQASDALAPSTSVVLSASNLMDPYWYEPNHPSLLLV